MTAQLITPNPHIPCEPGYCLQYVRETFGLGGVYPSATSGWSNAQYKHRDQNFPDAWVPLWFFMADEPLGHVVLRAPDGSIFSTSDDSTVPHHHPNLADLMGYYARYGLPLMYLGWSEDIETVRVVNVSNSIEYTGFTQSPQEDELSAAEVQEIKDHINDVFLGDYAWDGRMDNPGLAKVLIETQKRVTAHREETRAAFDALPTRVWWGTTVVRDGKEIAVIQDQANVRTEQLGQGQVLVEIADSVSPGALATLVTEANAEAVIEAIRARLAATEG
ncbi:hypothetical protein ARTHRO9V_130186 [Arthrobacter sp. 9V]|uniref:hypothetical protein n=1 Tax=Arthrobacter sp. 9V TaxID=2653132 RepID=UPI0012F3FE8A|nr:hypothetical protein [Arthrobacter sp. 9V]VXB24428.1 hypothetical protein ARTHRO9V_130186 [Arthrobacter sp. 9V]